MNTETLISDLSSSIDPEAVWRCLGQAGAARDSLAPLVEASTAEATRLSSPRGAARVVAVERAARRQVAFDTDVVIEGRFLPHLFSGATGAVFLLATAGPGPEQRVAELFGSDDFVEAFVLDAAASAIAMDAFTVLAERVTGELQAQGYRIGPCIRPGTDAWDLQGQRPVFSLLPAAEVGVRLLDSLLMSPQKSQSGVIPFGRDLHVVDDPSIAPCRRCSARRCPMRVEPYENPVEQAWPEAD